MTLRFAIHGHCLVCKVKQRHWLGEADFCCASSFAFVTIFFAKKLKLYIWICQSYVQSTVGPFFSRTWTRKPHFSMTSQLSHHYVVSSRGSIDRTFYNFFSGIQSHGLSGWFVPKIMKSCLNLSKLRPKYCRSFFLDTVYEMNTSAYVRIFKK